jgi:curved DNA-binding protein CbpA
MSTNRKTGYSESSDTPDDAQLDYYEVLQVSPKAEQDVIEAAYRRLALKYHPDLNPTNPDAYRRMQEINEAYGVLKDPRRRNDYDRLLYAVPDFDLSLDDYEPPVRRRKNTKGQNFTMLGWLLAGMLLIGTFVFFGAQNNGVSRAPEPTPTVEVSRPVVTPPADAIVWDDFENVAGANWLLDNPWHVTTRFSASGRYSLWVGDESKGSYAPNIGAAATLVRPFDLSQTDRAILRFKIVGQTDYGQNANGEDRLFVEIAAAGKDFQTIHSASGLISSWQEVALDISRWKGKAVVVRFRFSSGATNSGAGFSGFFLDDIVVVPGK